MSNKKRFNTLYSVVTMYERSKGDIFANLNKLLKSIKPKLTEYEFICLKSSCYSIKDKIIHIFSKSSLSLYRYENNINYIDFDNIEHLFDDLDEEDRRLTTYNEKTS